MADVDKKTQAQDFNEKYPIQLPYYKVQEIQTTPSEHVPKGIDMINAQSQWKKGITGKDVTVAVIDSGINQKHPDLKNRIVEAKDFTTDGDPEDFNGHGSHTSGSIAADNQGNGIVGVAYDANIVSLKSLSGEGYGQMDWTLKALDYAIDQNVDIINMSLGGPHHPELQRLIRKAQDKGIIVVAAAGNSGDGLKFTPEVSFPGYYSEVVQVGAVDYQGNLARFSNTNDEVDVLAPGVQILSTYKNGQYAKLDGTSMASPHVAGALALMMSDKSDKNKPVPDTDNSKCESPNCDCEEECKCKNGESKIITDSPFAGSIGLKYLIQLRRYYLAILKKYTNLFLDY